MSAPSLFSPAHLLSEEAASFFRSQYGHPPTIVVHAPGRVNLIGEHTDYNNGFVLPAAISKTTVVAASPSDDGFLTLCSKQYDSIVRLPISTISNSREDCWTDYPAGVWKFLRERGIVLEGAMLAINSDIPQGGGLSSSAALEIACAYAFLALSGKELPPVDVIKLCQQAENEFVGVQCGIMDQFVSCLGQKNSALFLDCKTLEYHPVPLPLGVRLLVCDTGVKRQLTSSEYNKRRAECSLGVKAISATHRTITSLRDVSPELLQQFHGAMDPVVFKRCRHVVTENERVLRSVDALGNSDLQTFGRLMLDSHASLRDDYEVSCRELDTMVELCSDAQGVIGARMTGAGFGGCALCLVKGDDLDGLVGRLKVEYPKRTGRQPTFHACSAEDGVAVERL